MRVCVCICLFIQLIWHIHLFCYFSYFFLFFLNLNVLHSDIYEMWWNGKFFCVWEHFVGSILFLLSFCSHRQNDSCEQTQIRPNIAIVFVFVMKTRNFVWTIFFASRLPLQPTFIYHTKFISVPKFFFLLRFWFRMKYFEQSETRTQFYRCKNWSLITYLQKHTKMWSSI